jgi:hypothetical protein
LQLTEETRSTSKVLAGKPEGKKSLQMPRHILEDNIKLFITETCRVMDWFHLPQDRDQIWIFLNMVMNLQILYSVGPDEQLLAS